MNTASRRVPAPLTSSNSSRSSTIMPAARTSAGLPTIAATPWSTVAPLATTPPSAFIAAPAGTFPARDPAAYAMQLDGDCLAPDVVHGSVAIMSPAAPLTRGGFVALHFRDGRTPQIKRLANLPPSAVLAGLGRPGANVAGLVLVSMTNPARLISYRSAELLAVHAVVEIVQPEDVKARRTVAPAVAAGLTGADAELLRLCGEYAALDVVLADAEKRHGEDDAYTSDAGRLETDSLVGQQQALVPQIVAAGCTTPAGVVALAGLVADTDCDRDYPTHSAHERFPAMILRALNAGAVPVPPKPAPHPDDALIRLGEQFVVAHRVSETAWEAAVDEPQAQGPLTQEACRLSEVVRPIAAAIEQLRATTHTGLIVKLRVMMWHRGGVHEADRQSPYPQDWTLASMADDLAAMDVTMTGAGVQA